MAKHLTTGAISQGLTGDAEEVERLRRVHVERILQNIEPVSTRHSNGSDPGRTVSHLSLDPSRDLCHPSRVLVLNV